VVSFEGGLGGLGSRIEGHLGVGESFLDHAFQHQLRRQCLPPVDLGVLIFLFWLKVLIKQPRVEFLIDHRYFIVHLSNHYSNDNLEYPTSYRSDSIRLSKVN
jgi:hypothetical protein